MSSFSSSKKSRQAAAKSGYPMLPDTVKGLIVIQNRILLQHRDDDKRIYLPGHWGLFGGEVEYGESGEEALRRELSEELSLSSYKVGSSFFWTNKETTTLLCIYSVFPFQPVDSLVLTEGQGMGLFYLEELEKMRVTPDITMNQGRIATIIRQASGGKNS